MSYALTIKAGTLSDSTPHLNLKAVQLGEKPLISFEALDFAKVATI